MRKVTMPNFCINFLNKAEKSLPILYDFAVAPLTGAWIKTPISTATGTWYWSRTPHGCVD